MILQKFCSLPPRHPALAKYCPDKFPWQNLDEWHIACEMGSVHQLPPSSNTGGNLALKEGKREYRGNLSNDDYGIDRRYGEALTVYATGKGKYRTVIISQPEGWIPKAAIIDTLTFTFPEKNFEHGKVVDEDVMDDLSGIFNVGIGLGICTARRPGKNFYQSSFDLVYPDGDSSVNLGFVAIGGNNETICVHITGKGCMALSDERLAWLEDWLRDTVKGKITEIHLAHDDFKGEYSVDLALEWWKDRKFKSVFGGRNPSVSQGGNWVEPDGKGRTLYVGKRENGKMMRIYEKGKQMGDAEHPWTRWEGELRSKDREIPFDVLTNPGGYLAGMYPCLDWIERDVCRVKIVRKTAKIIMDDFIRSAKNAYGKFITVLEELEWTPEQIVDGLKRPKEDGPPKRLIIPRLQIVNSS